MKFTSVDSLLSISWPCDTFSPDLKIQPSFCVLMLCTGLGILLTNPTMEIKKQS